MPDHKFFSMAFAEIYPLYVQKAEKKNRTEEEVEDPLMRKIRYLDKLIDELANLFFACIEKPPAAVRRLWRPYAT